MIRRIVGLCVLTALLSLLPIGSVQACRNWWVDISPDYQLLHVGHTASVTVSWISCGEPVVFEVHGPHPHAEVLGIGESGSRIDHTYEYDGTLPGWDEMSVTLTSGGEVFQAEAQVEWLLCTDPVSSPGCQ